MKTIKNSDVELEKLAIKAMNKLGELIDKQDSPVEVAKTCSSILSAWTQARRARSSERATMFVLARELATDREQLARYISVTNPEAGVLLQLPQATELAEENKDLKKRIETLERQRNAMLLNEAIVKGTLVTPGD